MKRALLIALTLTSCLGGCAGWSKRDMALGGVYLAASTLDMMQTTTIASRCDEANPLIGDCGQHMSPQVWFLATDFLGFVLLSELHSDQRGWILGLADGLEIKTVQRNWMNNGVAP